MSERASDRDDDRAPSERSTAPDARRGSDLARWRAKQQHYQDVRVASEYDLVRASGPLGERATERKWRAIERAMGDELAACATFLDVPHGTGRFAASLERAGKRWVAADLSSAMLSEALRSPRAGRMGAVRCDVARLPFADASVDCVLSIRFLFHVPRELRPAILREMARVARRCVVVDVRHAYCVTTWTRRARALLTGRRSPHRYTLAELDADFAAAGLAIVRKHWLAPPFSEKMVVLARRAEAEEETNRR